MPERDILVPPITRAQLQATPDATVFRIGHFTVLLKLNDAFWLTDSVFAEGATPFQWLGLKRFHQPPIKDLILSDDHPGPPRPQRQPAPSCYTELFFIPLGVGDRLVAWGVPASKVQ